jgi:hypothetical protein
MRLLALFAAAAMQSMQAAAVLYDCDYGTADNGVCGGKHSYCVSHIPPEAWL